MEHLLIKDEAPTTSPPNVGVHWVDKTNKRMWFSVGTASAADWKELTGTVGSGQRIPTTYLVSTSPEGVTSAFVGDWAWDTVAKFLYFKETGDGTNTGWVVH